jgi:hypothetical protein
MLTPEDPLPKRLERIVTKLVEIAEQRRAECQDPAIRGLRTTGVDWMTPCEQRILEAIKLKQVALLREYNSTAAAQARVAAKRQSRLDKKEPSK